MNRAVIVPVPPNIWNDALGLGAIASSSSRLFRLRRPIAPGGGYASPPTRFFRPKSVRRTDAVAPTLASTPEPYHNTRVPTTGTLLQCLAVFLEVALS